MWEKLLDIGVQPRRIFHRHGLLTPANAIAMSRQDTETPFVDHWFPRAVVNVNVRQQYRVRSPSLCVFAVASPDMSQTSASVPLNALAETDWGQIKYIDHVVERAMLDLLGITEAGAETPWEEASALLRRHLDPVALEMDAGVFTNITWQAAGELVFDHVVPGRMPSQVLTGGR